LNTEEAQNIGPNYMFSLNPNHWRNFWPWGLIDRSTCFSTHVISTRRGDGQRLESATPYINGKLTTLQVVQYVRRNWCDCLCVSCYMSRES